MMILKVLHKMFWLYAGMYIKKQEILVLHYLD